MSRGVFSDSLRRRRPVHHAAPGGSRPGSAASGSRVGGRSRSMQVGMGRSGGIRSAAPGRGEACDGAAGQAPKRARPDALSDAAPVPSTRAMVSAAAQRPRRAHRHRSSHAIAVWQDLREDRPNGRWGRRHRRSPGLPPAGRPPWSSPVPFPRAAGRASGHRPTRAEAWKIRVRSQAETTGRRGLCQAEASGHPTSTRSAAAALRLRVENPP